MKLYSAPASPFVRKVRMVLALRGLDRDVALLPTDTADPADGVHTANPLGKIPALELDDGTVLFDSRVIAEYFDAMGTRGPRLFPDGDDRWTALRLQALGDGICDAAILCVYEKRYRPEDMRNAAWVEKQWKRVDDTLDSLADVPLASGENVRIGEISIAVALGYLDLRFEGQWRDRQPALTAWFDKFAAAEPAFAATAPV